ncbi:MAG TPA: sensor domain-containing protein [Streptosporangiaceae bacterium]|nr:sensor domain-containing protein [Streptosporangiaceae bacterium]
MAAAGIRSGAAWAGLPVTALRAVVSARTWLAIIHLLSGWVIGLAAFVMIVAGVPVGCALLVVALSGIVVFWAVLLLCGQLARAERRRFEVLLGEHITAPPVIGRPASGWRGGWRGWWQLFWRPFGALDTWREFLYALLRFPLSTAEGAILVGVWSIGFAMAALPGYVWLLPRGSTLWSTATPVPRSPAAVAAIAIAGLVLLLAAPQLTRALAIADTAVARFLLGSRDRSALQARIGELERSRARVVDSAEAERRRIERDLHDGAQQRLVALAMDLGRARARFADDPEAARAIVDQAHAEAKEALVELRNLVRGVHPPVLTDRGLDAALSGLAALSPVPVTVTVDVSRRPPASIEAIAYFVVAEALTNVAKHSRAAAAQVRVERHGDTLGIVIRDNGTGGADPAGRGLSGLADRVAGVDGGLSIDSPPGGGTLIKVELPCGS